MRKMFSFTAIRSKDARISPLVASGSIRGSLATRFSFYFGANPNALEALGVGRPYLGIDQARRPLAVERVENLLGGDLAHVHPRFPGHTGGVRARQHIVELQQRMIRRRRFLGPDVEAGAGNLLVAQRFGSAASSWMKPRAVVMK